MKGSLQPELSDASYIRCSSGYTAKIEYTSKGWMGGTRNGFSATLYRDGCEKQPLYTVDGKWCEAWVCKDMRTNTEVERFDVNDIKRSPLQVAPIEEQHPLESRRAWKPVVDAINNGDISAVSQEKGKIENEQRDMRKQEKEQDTDFPRRYFSLAQEDAVADRLAEGYECMKAEMDGQHGLWMWDEEKYRKMLGAGNRNPSYRRDTIDSGVVMMDEENKA